MSEAMRYLAVSTLVVAVTCQTMYCFDEDGSVIMTWLPSMGDAQILKAAWMEALFVFHITVKTE